MNGRLISVSIALESSTLAFSAGFFQPLERHLVVVQVDSLVLFEFVDDPADEHFVDVVAAEMRVAVGRFHFDNAFADLKDRDIESTAAEVENGDSLVLFLVQTVSKCRGGRLVDDTQYLKSGDLAGVFRRLPLSVVKISRNSNYRLVDLGTEIIFGRLLQLLQAPSPRSRAGCTACRRH